MLLTKEVEVKIGSNNYKYYLGKGYELETYINSKGKTSIKFGSKIMVKIEDLQKYSNAIIRCTCDFCGKELENKYGQYNRQLEKNGFIRCISCGVIQASERERNKRILNGENFENMCQEYDLFKWIENWDTDTNTEDTPSTLSTTLDVNRYFKCDKGIHNSFSKSVKYILRYKAPYKCPYCNSFGQYLIDEFGEDGIKKYWSDKNEESPFEISKGSSKKVWVRCQTVNYHEDYLMSPDKFTTGKHKCPQCSGYNNNVHIKDSFGTYLEENNLLYLWSDKNEINPYEISRNTSKLKILMKCEKTAYHEDYCVRPSAYLIGSRCPYCSKKYLNSLDSFAQYHIDNTDKNFIENYWSEKNSISPYEIAPSTLKQVWIKCQCDVTHEDYLVRCRNFTDGSRCPNCRDTRGESKVRTYLTENNIAYESQKTFINLVGVGVRDLRYDFYLPQHNLLIEYQGDFHYRTIYFSKETKEYCEERFKIQQEHDRRKREYAKAHNITLLEIPYWDYDNIDSILAEALNITNTDTKDNDTNNSNNINNTNNINNNIINTYNKLNSDNIYTKAKVNKEEFDFPTVEEIMRM